MFLGAKGGVVLDSMCNKALLLSKGEALFFGNVDEAFDVYASLG